MFISKLKNHDSNMRCAIPRYCCLLLNAAILPDLDRENFPALLVQRCGDHVGFFRTKSYNLHQPFAHPSLVAVQYLPHNTESKTTPLVHAYANQKIQHATATTGLEKCTMNCPRRAQGFLMSHASSFFSVSRPTPGTVTFPLKFAISCMGTDWNATLTCDGVTGAVSLLLGIA